MTKIVDPFITGPNPFQEKFQVAEADVERARAALAAAGAGGADDDEDEDDDADTTDSVEDLASLTIFLAVLLVTLPLVVFPGVAYLFACRRHGRRSRRHGIVMLVLAAPFVLGAVFYAVRRWPPPEDLDDLDPPPVQTPIGPR